MAANISLIGTRHSSYEATGCRLNMTTFEEILAGATAVGENGVPGCVLKAIDATGKLP